MHRFTGCLKGSLLSDLTWSTSSTLLVQPPHIMPSIFSLTSITSSLARANTIVPLPLTVAWRRAC